MPQLEGVIREVMGSNPGAGKGFFLMKSLFKLTWTITMSLNVYDVQA